MSLPFDHERLILTAKPGSRAITPRHVSAIWDRLAAFERIGEGWLSEGEAWHGALRLGSPAAVATAKAVASDALAGLPVDVNVVAGGATGSKLLVADMESTIIEQEMLDELADYVGLRQQIAGITKRAMDGDLDFESALRERVGLLKGLDAKVLDEVYARVTLMPGARTLVATLKKQGAYCALVSGGFTVFTGPVASELGFDEHQANVLEIDNGRLSGAVRNPILGREAKLAALERLRTQLGLEAKQTIAVGDGANDLAMLAEAGIGVAFHAKPRVREAAAAMPGGAVVAHGDLTALLYLQGIPRSEFVS